MKGVDIKIVKTAAVEDMISLYKDAGWWKAEYEEDLSFLHGIVKGSACFAGAFHGGRMIGMGRALSDCVSDAYIQDVVVLSDYRGQGIGGGIIKELGAWLKSRGVDWIGLIGEPGTGPFYEKLGFERMGGYVPLLLKDI